MEVSRFDGTLKVFQLIGSVNNLNVSPRTSRIFNLKKIKIGPPCCFTNNNFDVDAPLVGAIGTYYQATTYRHYLLKQLKC